MEEFDSVACDKKAAEVALKSFDRLKAAPPIVAGGDKE